MTAIIGIDCATDPGKVGLAYGLYADNELRIKDARKASKKEPISQVVFEWIADAEDVLIAIDAPLGWPIDMGTQLNSHQAGDFISVLPNQLFRRETDRVIKRIIGKQSLDVGADRIARTAHAALSLLGELRAITGQPIPLAWNSGQNDRVMAIEVYPAATLKVREFISSGYKKPSDMKAREEIIDSLGELLAWDMNIKCLVEDDDILDAVICVLSGADYLSGDVIKPEDLELSKKEGWIWVKNPESIARNR